MTIYRTIFVALLLTAGVTFFSRTLLSTVDSIRPESFLEPLQTPAVDTNVITFVSNGYRYDATPLFDYLISGLVVHKLDYSWFAIDRSERAFVMDLCIAWGDNLQLRLYRKQSVKFSQDCRFCNVEWGAGVPFRMDQLSNNHLLVNNAALLKKLKSILAGDQVTIQGKLVNVTGHVLGEPGRFDSESVAWNTSTTRTDTGPGACEVIYVEDVRVLQHGNPVSRLLFAVSLSGLGLMVAWSVVNLFRP